MPRCLIIAGPNGAGKTTFAREYLPREGAVLHFVNADLLAAGLSPFDPYGARVAAGRLFLREIDRLAASKVDFAFESTLSGTAYLARLKRMRTAGYDVEIVYLRLSDVRLALQRVATRVRSGGHDVPVADVLRRFPRSWENFQHHYRPLSKRSWVFDVSGATPILLSTHP
jgi:predicted ABC-type ATPase